MADYDVKDESQQDGAPYELFLFAGTYRNYTFTTDYLPHVFEGKTYAPVAGLKRGAVMTATHEVDNSDMIIDVPIGEQLVKDYAFQTTPPSLILTIYRFHRSASTYVEYFKGPISSISITNEFAQFRAASKFGTILQGNIPNVFVQPPCNNVLFDELCKVPRVANSLDTEVSGVEGRNVMIPSLGGFPDGWFIGGEISVSARNERRMIVGQSGTVLTVNYEFSRLSIGTAIQVTAGCDHSYNGANGCPKFNNQRNFGGCPFVPGESQNVFVSGVK